MLSKVYKFKFLLVMMLVPFLVSAQPPGWNDPTSTLFTHNLVIPATVTPEINGVPIQTGDWVGVFFNDGGDLVCGGLIHYTAGVSNAFSAFGNDPLTPEKDGFNIGESLLWRIYVDGDDSYWAEAVVDGPEVFTVFAFTTVESLTGPTFAVIASASPDVVCGAGADVTLTGTQVAGDPISSWEWFDNGALVGSGQSITVFVDETTTFRLEASDGTLIAEAKVTVDVIFATAGDDQHLCADEDEVQLDGFASGFVGLNWTTSGTGSFSDAGILNPIYFPSELDKTDGVTLTMNVVTLDCGLFSEDLEVTFQPAPHINILPDQDYVCSGDSYDFTDKVDASNFDAIQWFTTNGGGIFEPNENELEPIYVPSPTVDWPQTCIEIGVTASAIDPCTVSAEDFMILCFVAPPTAFAGDEVELCEDEAVAYTFADAEVTFDPNWGGEILWTTTGDGTFDDETIANPTYTFGANDLLGGMIYFTLTATTPEACDPAVSETSIFIQLEPAINIVPDTYTICEGEVMDFDELVEASNYSALQWFTVNGGGTFDDETALFPIYTPSPTVDYPQGCITIGVAAVAIDPCSVSAEDFMELCFQMLPVVVAGEDATVCSHELFTTDPSVENSDGPYMWTSDPLDAGTFADPTALVTTFDPNPDYEGQTVQLILTADPIAPCAEPVSGAMDLYIEFAPYVNAGPDMTICETETAIIEGECEHVEITMWATTGDGHFICPDFSCEQVEYVPGPGDLAEGCVTLILIGYPKSPCTLWVLDKMKLCFDKAPVVDAGDDQTICQGDVAQLNATAENFCGLQWVTLDGTGTFSDENILDPIYTPSFQDAITGTVHLTLIAAGCDACNYPVESTVALTIQWSPIVDAGEDFTGCEDGFALDMATASHYSSLLWTGGDGTFDDETALNPFYTAGAGDIDAGFVELCLTAEPIDPCTVAVTDCLMVEIQGLPTIEIIPDAATICFGDVFDFTGQVVAGNYLAIQWFTTNGAGIFDPNETVLEPTYQPSPSIDYPQGCIEIGVVASPIDPCTVSAEDFMILCFQAPPTVDAGDDATICEDGSFTTTPIIENGGDVEWVSSGTGTWDDNTLPNATYTPSADDIAAGSVELTITVEGLSTCEPDEDSMTLYFQLLPIANAGDDVTVCEQLCMPPWTNGIVELEGAVENACGSMWETMGDGTFDDANSLTAVYTLGAGDILAGEVILKLHALPCDPCTVHGHDELVVTVQPFPMADAGPDQTICEGDDAQLDGYAENYSGVFWDYALLGEGDGTFSNQLILDPVYTPGPEDIALGYVELILVAFPIDPCTYPAASLMTLNITPAPIANAGPDVTICEGETFFIGEATAENADYVLWTTAGDGSFDPSDDVVNPTYIPGPMDIANGGVELCLEAFDGSECDHIEFKDCMFLTINPPPVVDAGPDATICEYEVFTLADATADNVSSILWTTSGDGEFDDDELLNASYTPGPGDKAAGTVELTITGFPIEPCTIEVTSSMTLTINAEPILGFCFNDVLAVEGFEAEYCFDELVTVSLCEVVAGVGPFTVVYEVNGDEETAVVDLGENLFSDLLEPGDYVIQVISITDANGCMSQNVEPYHAFITINPEPVAAFCFNGELAETGSVFEYCYDVEVDVTLCAIVDGEGPFEVCYSINGEPEVCVTVAEGESLFTDILDAGTYVIEITSITDANGCQVADVAPYTATVIIHPEPALLFAFDGNVAFEGSEFEYCYDEIVTVTLFEVLSGTAPFNLAWTVNGTPYTAEDVMEGDVLFSEILEPGTYLVEITSIVDANGCEVEDVSPYNATVVVHPEPFLVFAFNGVQVAPGFEETYCEDTPVVVTLDEIWYGVGPFEVCYSINGEPEVCVTVENIGDELFNSLMDPGVYTVLVTSLTDLGTGCEASQATLDLYTAIITIQALPTIEPLDDVTICEYEAPYFIDATAANYSSLLWTTSGTGTFDDETAEDATYTPSADDLAMGYVELCLTAEPIDPCTISVTECFILTINPEPFVGFCFNDVLAGANAEFEYCYDEVVTVSLCEVWAGVGPFTIVYEVNGVEETAVVELGENLFSEILPAGTYEIVVTSITDFNGCSNQDVSPYQATVVVNPEPFLIFAFNGVQAVQGFEATYCEDTPVVVTLLEIGAGVGPFEVCYQINTDPVVCVTVENVGDELFNSLMDPGVYSVIVTSLVDLGSECVASQDILDLYTAEITIQALPIVEPLADAPICEDDEYQLMGYAENYSSILWTGGNGFSDPTILDPIYTPTADDIAAGFVELCLTAEPIDPCTISATECMTLTIQGLPVVYAGDDETICEDEVFTTSGTADNALFVEWSTSGDGLFFDENEPITQYTPGEMDIANGFVQLTLTGFAISPCQAEVSHTMTLSFDPAPFAYAGEDDLICEGDEFELDLATAENYSALLWTGGDGTFTPSNDVLNPSYTPGPGDLAAGTVDLCLTAFGDGACTGEAVSCLTLTVVPNPTIDLVPDIELSCENYDFVDRSWLPIPVCAIVEFAESVQWSTSGDGFFDDAEAACTNYNLGDNDKWAQQITLTLEATGLGSCGFVAVAEVVLHIPTQLIFIDDPTWWGISSYVDKSAATVPDVMYPAVGDGPGSNDLVIMINKGGQYYWPEPSPPINQLGNWAPIGYKAKFKNETCIPIYGDVVTDFSFEVGGPQLFTYVPVLTNVVTPINDLFAGHLDDILLIYDWNEAQLWTNVAADFTEFLPGKAYLLVRVFGTDPYTVNFPPFDPDAGIIAKSGFKSVLSFNTPWNDVTNTAQTHFVLFANEVLNKMQPGDVIGAFNAYDMCVGVGEYGSKDQLMKVLAMGSDPLSGVVDGFETGENMTFKLYRPGTGELFDLEFTYDMNYPNYDNTFEVNGVSFVVDMTMTSTSIDNVPSDLSVNIFPNPARDVLNIVSGYEIKSVSLVNLVGQTVYSRNVFGNEIQINVSSYNTGMYIVQLETIDGTVITRRIAID